MKLNNIKYKEFILKNIKRLNKNNLAFSLFVLAIAFLYTQSNQSKMLDMLKNKDKEISTVSSYITYITDAGVVKQYQRQTFDVYNEKENVENVLSRYLIQSAYNLTNGYKKVYFTNARDLFQYSKDFREFYINFIHINKKIATNKHLEEYKSVQRDWQQILTYFVLAINQNNLPQVIDKKLSGIQTKDWNTHGEEFSISFVVPLYAKSRNKHNAIDEGVTYAQITAKGYFNLFDKTLLNPKGLKFTSLQLIHPSIDQSKRPK